jgi:hypothetical protein
MPYIMKGTGVRGIDPNAVPFCQLPQRSVHSGSVLRWPAKEAEYLDLPRAFGPRSPMRRMLQIAVVGVAGNGTRRVGHYNPAA